MNVNKADVGVHFGQGETRWEFFSERKHQNLVLTAKDQKADLTNTERTALAVRRHCQLENLDIKKMDGTVSNAVDDPDALLIGMQSLKVQEKPVQKVTIPSSLPPGGHVDPNQGNPSANGLPPGGSKVDPSQVQPQPSQAQPQPQPSQAQPQPQPSQAQPQPSQPGAGNAAPTLEHTLGALEARTSSADWKSNIDAYVNGHPPADRDLARGRITAEVLRSYENLRTEDWQTLGFGPGLSKDLSDSSVLSNLDSGVAIFRLYTAAGGDANQFQSYMKQFQGKSFMDDKSKQYITLSTAAVGLMDSTDDGKTIHEHIGKPGDGNGWSDATGRLGLNDAETVHEAISILKYESVPKFPGSTLWDAKPQAAGALPTAFAPRNQPNLALAPLQGTQA